MDGIGSNVVHDFELDDQREHSVDGMRRTVVKRGLIGFVALGCIVATSTGCSQVVQGQATAAEQGSVTPSGTTPSGTTPSGTSPSGARPNVPAGELFDPCSVPLKSLDPQGALGLKDTVTPPTPPTPGGFGICIWTSADYSLSVNLSVSEYIAFENPESIPSLEDVRSKKVGDTEFDVFRITTEFDDDGTSQSCNAQTETSAGNVSLSVIEIDFQPTEPIDACATTEGILRSLEPYLPAPK